MSDGRPWFQGLELISRQMQMRPVDSVLSKVNLHTW